MNNHPTYSTRDSGRHSENDIGIITVSSLVEKNNWTRLGPIDPIDPISKTSLKPID